MLARICHYVAAASLAAQYMPCIDISASLIITSALRPAAVNSVLQQHAQRKSQTFTCTFQNFIALILLLLVLHLQPSLSTCEYKKVCTLYALFLMNHMYKG